MLKLIACVAIFCLPAAVAFAAMGKPAEIVPSIRAATPYGEGEESYMWLTPYRAALWTDAQHWSMDETFALTLQYEMDFTVRQLVECSIDQMDKQEALPVDQSERYREELSAAFHDVHDGDTISALYLPDKGARIYYNGKLTGSLDNELAVRFLAIWLSEKTASPDLRDSLLNLSLEGH